MFTQLSQFYTSSDWRKFREVLIAQRTNKEDGLLYDENTGLPLVKAYDIVLHHKEPLTLQNVNDYSVSLNPDNVMIVSQKSHNEIHARFGHMTQKKVYYVYGPPCAGKTTFVQNVKGNSDIVCDVDNIWECLTAGDRYGKPQALKQNVFAVRDAILDMIRTRAGRWERAYIIEGGALRSEREHKIEAYDAEAIFIDTDMDTCLRRLHADKERTDKETWETYIRRWFADYVS